MKDLGLLLGLNTNKDGVTYFETSMGRRSFVYNFELEHAGAWRGIVDASIIQRFYNSERIVF